MGKYEYKSSWKDLQKEFPDYPLEKYVNESSKIWCLNNISNELAEANKLKKHELSIENYDGSPFTPAGEGEIPDETRF